MKGLVFSKSAQTRQAAAHKDRFDLARCQNRNMKHADARLTSPRFRVKIIG